MGHQRLAFRVHALQHMFQRGINEKDIAHVLTTGRTIEIYPDDQPYPSRLILGWLESRPLHVVVADNQEEQTTIVITAYEPDFTRWEPGFERRRQ